MVSYLKNLNWENLAKILKILIISYIIFVFAICLFKYFTFQYNGLDLAIFNQVFYNSSLGNLYQFTIHPTSYLGDHFELIIFLLVPFYSLLKSPVSLLLLQTLFLAFASIPLYLIAKKHLNPWPTLFILFLYLFNPVTLNINLFEFHALALAPFFVFWTFYFYDQNKFPPFLAFAILSLLVREDVSFVIFMFGILALIDKKKIKWILAPIVLAPLYFFTALKIVSYFSASQSYKFLIYYQWLGQTPWEIFKNLFLKFPLVLEHVFNLANLELVLGFFLVFLFIPLCRPKYLLLALGAFLQIILGFASGELILRTHYGAIFLTAMTIAAIFSLKILTSNPKLINFSKKYKNLLPLLIIAGLVYNFLVLGPLPSFAQKIAALDYQEAKLKKIFVNQIPPGASVVATYDLIPNLSSRKQIYSLNYLFLGRQQYGAGDYKIPDDTQYLLINFDDFITFHLQYEKFSSPYYYKGSNNLREIITGHDFKLKKAEKNLALWQKNLEKDNFSLYQIHESLPLQIDPSLKQKINHELEFLALNKETETTSLYFQALTQIDKNYFIQINDKIYPLGYGLYPTSEWQKKQIVQIIFFSLPEIKELKILDLAGGLELDSLGSVKNILDKAEIISQIAID